IPMGYDPDFVAQKFDYNLTK
ncbi:unnamed protein product, partial [Adineta steineri]